jgi:autoinducer 2-degrading protein
MLIRIVRMEFTPEKVPDFLKIFEEVQPHIAGFPGCEGVKLKRDATHENVFYTHSIWINEPALEAYRKSPFFDGTWTKTKQLFCAKPMAFSLIDP